MNEKQRAERKAQATARKIVEAKPNQLQIDLDSYVSLSFFERQFSILKDAKITRGWRVRLCPSRSRGHFHVTITLPEDYPGEYRVALQLILGSDAAREAHNFCRVVNGTKYQVVLFR